MLLETAFQKVETYYKALQDVSVWFHLGPLEADADEDTRRHVRRRAEGQSKDPEGARASGSSMGELREPAQGTVNMLELSLTPRQS